LNNIGRIREQNRNTFFDREQRYTTSQLRATRRGNDFAALSYSERSRARSLLASLEFEQRSSIRAHGLPEICGDSADATVSIPSERQLIIRLITRN
jgi:hypothetical protein